MDSVNMENNAIAIKPEKNRYASVKKKKNLFFFLMALPFLIEVAIFYLYVNISSFAMAFLEYELVPGKGDVSTFVWFNNFSNVLSEIFSPSRVSMIGFSFLMYGFVLLFITPIVIFFSFYIYKNFFLSNFFRVILFMPQIVSSVVYVTIYKTMLGPVYTQLTGNPDVLSGDTLTIMLALIFYVFWTGFGTNILLMSGAMSAIDNSVVEACHLDGCNMTKEFIYVTLPSIYPTITTFVVLDLTTLFTNTMHLYTFFGASSEVKSVGYYIEINTMNSPGLVRDYKTDAWLDYPRLSALGFLITVTVTPLTLIVRRLLEKFGPSED